MKMMAYKPIKDAIKMRMRFLRNIPKTTFCYCVAFALSSNATFACDWGHWTVTDICYLDNPHNKGWYFMPPFKNQGVESIFLKKDFQNGNLIRVDFTTDHKLTDSLISGLKEKNIVIVNSFDSSCTLINIENLEEFLSAFKNKNLIPESLIDSIIQHANDRSPFNSETSLSNDEAEGKYSLKRIKINSYPLKQSA